MCYVEGNVEIENEIGGWWSGRGKGGGGDWEWNFM